MNSILKQPTKVRIAAAVLLVAGAAGAVALMRGSPAQSSEKARAASRRQAGGGRRARRRRQTAGRGHAGRGAGGSGRAAAPAAGAAPAARAAQGQSRGPGSMAARPARREGLDRTGAGAGVAGQARGQARFPGGAGTDPDAELPGIRQPRARRLSDRGRPGLRGERAKPQLAQPALYRVSQIFLPAPLATPRPWPPRASRRRNWSSGPRRPRPISPRWRARQSAGCQQPRTGRRHRLLPLAQLTPEMRPAVEQLKTGDVSARCSPPRAFIS